MTRMPLEKSPMRAPAGRIAELADQCVQCGLCLPVCPTYALDRSEAESPRGRIAIASALARGLADPTADLREHLDHCLGCLNCEKVCPANVQYDELLIETRSMLGPARTRPRLLLGLIRRPRVMRVLGALARGLGMSWWRSRLLRLFPAGSSWGAALAIWPMTRPAAPVHSGDQKSGIPKLALFPGCVASIDDAQAQQAAVELLQAAGFQVDILPAFCCGAMDLHGGEASGAEQAAEQVRKAWGASHATQLISITPGCIGTLRRALPEVEVIDPVTLLAAHADALHFKPLSQRVAVHLPCTQINVARSDVALTTLLRRIPGLEVMLLPRPPFCCGAAGSHMLEFPERAERLRDETLQRISTLEPERLLSSNIGCRLHLSAGFAPQAMLLQHPLTLLAQQLESSL
jgi:glycolate oxidase iron-sulfur subunit